MKTTETPAAFCPVCEKALDRASSAFGDAAPEPGDVSICLGCLTTLVFEADLRLRRMTGEEANRMPVGLQIQIAKIRRAIRSAKAGEG